MAGLEIGTAARVGWLWIGLELTGGIGAAAVDVARVAAAVGVSEAGE